MAAWTLQPDTVFEGKYLIERQIGEGGFAAVYRARDIKSNRILAIKVLTQGEEHWQQGERLAQRFEREAQLLAELSNEHTVRLLEYNQSREGALYLVFEYVDGIDLHALVQRDGPLAPGRVVQILQQVCSALSEAHQLGVLHRDIKPANVMVYAYMNVRDLVKLLDFGIAKPMGRDDETGTGGLTTVGVVLGTPRYMSPEQISGSRLSPSSDIYSLGLVAFELLTGTGAIASESRSGIVREQLAPLPFTWPKEPRVPKSLRKIIDKMLEKDRRERYQTCNEVLMDLAAWTDETAISPKMIATAGGAAAGVLLLAILAVVALGGDDEPTQPEVASAVAVAQTVARAPEKQQPKAEARPRVQTSGVPHVVLPPDNDDLQPTSPERPRPPEDEIKPLQLRSSAQAKSHATAAYTMGDWPKVIAACKPFAERYTFCARMLAEAYKSLDDVDRACYWFESVRVEGHGLDCPVFEDE